MPDSDNGRVTLAILAEKIDALTKKVDAMGADHDRLVIAEACVHENQRDIQEVSIFARNLQDRLRMAELQLAKTAVVYGLLSGSGGAVLTVLITKALGI